jgi:hypothetical protein
MKNPYWSVQPQQGQPLPNDWQAKAKDRARLAEADYLWRLQNGWKQGNENPDPNIMRASRLSSDGKGLSQEELQMCARLNNNGNPSWEDLYGQK